MIQSNDLEWMYQELRRRAVAQFGEDRAVDLKSYLRTSVEQICDVANAEVHPNLEPLNREWPGRCYSVMAANGAPSAARMPPSARLNHA